MTLTSLAPGFAVALPLGTVDVTVDVEAPGGGGGGSGSPQPASETAVSSTMAHQERPTASSLINPTWRRV